MYTLKSLNLNLWRQCTIFLITPRKCNCQQVARWLSNARRPTRLANASVQCQPFSFEYRFRPKLFWHDLRVHVLAIIKFVRKVLTFLVMCFGLYIYIYIYSNLFQQPLSFKECFTHNRKSYAILYPIVSVTVIFLYRGLI